MVSDTPLLDQMVAGLRKDSRFSTLVRQIVNSPQFRFLRFQRGEPGGEPPGRTAAVVQPGRGGREAH